MPDDSIMARPTNNVLEIVDEASGCCAMEVSAAATALPSPRDGAITPIAVVMPEITIEAIAIDDNGSILVNY